MDVYISNSKSFYFKIELGEKDFLEHASLKLKSQILEKALQKLELDMILVADSSKKSKYNNFFWEFTYDIHRDDGIKDTVAEYYLIEILKYIVSENEINNVIVSRFLSKQTLKEISLLTSLKVEIKFLDVFRVFFRNKFGAIKYILRYLFTCFKFRNKKVFSNKHDYSIIFTNNKFDLSRFKRVPNIISKSFNVYCLNFSLTKVFDFKNQVEIDINSYNFYYFFKSIFRSFKIRKHISDKKYYIEKSIFSEKIRKQSYFQTYFVVIRYFVLNNFFSKANFKNFIVNTTIGDPNNRLAIAMARKNQLDTIVLSCRPFLSYLRSEDRVTSLDFIENNFFCDYFICFDKVSKNVLLKNGVCTDSIFVYKEQFKFNETKTFKDGFLLLFAHPQFNTDLIDLLRAAQLNEKIKFDKIFYREHPNVKLSKHNLDKLKTITNNLTCITDYLWEDITLNNVLSFTSNSTSGIESVARGASIVWLPFLSEHSTQFKPMMDAVGVVSTTKAHFFSLLRQMNLQKRKELSELSQKQYNKNIKDEHSFNELLDRII